jgi:uncharacterized membrane protein HdeD (DUF308 family)
LIGSAIASGSLHLAAPGWKTQSIRSSDNPQGDLMIIIGIVLLLLGFLLKVAILWTLGIIVLVVGLILLLLGSLGHAVGPRRHYW